MKSFVFLLTLTLAACSFKEKTNDVYIRPEGSGGAVVVPADPTGGEYGKAQGYPEEWWAPVTGAPNFKGEIFPQEAKAGEVILSKRHPKLGLLSNFAATPFYFNGRKYASLEGFWQATKFPDPKLANDIRSTSSGAKWTHTRSEVEQMTAFDAKHAGDEGSENMSKLKIDWVSFDGKAMVYKEQGDSDFYRLIYLAMIEKFMQNKDVCEILKQTGDLKLRADHDTSKNPAKAWNYFDIWMELRTTYVDFDCASIK